jgi:hypothetical protein
MKTTIFFAALLITFAFSACNKDTAAPTMVQNTFTVSDWTWDGNSKLLYSDVPWSEIDAEVADKGMLHLYLKTTNGDWAPLPRTVMLSGVIYDYAQSQRYTFRTGSFELIVQDDDLLQPNAPGTWTVRAVAVSGAQRSANSDLDWNNYEAVKERFNLSNK